MVRAIWRKLGSALESYLPEKRLFLRSDTGTRFIRLSPMTQAGALLGSSLLVAWAILSAAILLMDSVGSGSLRDRAERDQDLYEARLNSLASERDQHAVEAAAARERFNLALSEVSKMQSALLQSENRRKELESGMAAVRDTLRLTIRERDTALSDLGALSAEDESRKLAENATRLNDLKDTLGFLTAALQDTASERDTVARNAAEALEIAKEVDLDRRLVEERNERIFSQLEEALIVAVEPLDKMFKSAGLPTEQLIEQVRSGYSGLGGPLTPLTLSAKGGQPSKEEERANRILEGLDNLNLYRIAAQKAPFALPVTSSFRFTSGFGPRWGRMHNGTDFAASHGTAIHATADGVVTHADWSSGYGRLIKIKHSFGIETRYAHLSKIRVKVGQRVSRGERIGDMGNSGRSTGTHLHYEVRVHGNPVNPMNYIKAARDVF